MHSYITSGDSALIIKAGDEISETVNRSIRQLIVAVEMHNIKGITDYIPSYNELMICYDPLIIEYRYLQGLLQKIEESAGTIELPEPSVVEIPVHYGGESGPDIEEVAGLNNISEEDVIRIHSSVNYPVYMLGFTPGFCYLGGVDKRISTPRRKDPRLKIPAGSVGIADNQTGIYPIDSPGGWQLIGKTPVKLFDSNKKPEFLIMAGDYVKFNPVDKKEFSSIQKDVNSGIFQVKISKKK